MQNSGPWVPQLPVVRNSRLFAQHGAPPKSGLNIALESARALTCGSRRAAAGHGAPGATRRPRGSGMRQHRIRLVAGARPL